MSERVPPEVDWRASDTICCLSLFCCCFFAKLRLYLNPHALHSLANKWRR